jgi:hypothetical protein
MIKMVLDEIRRLSQGEGRNDGEIARLLGLSRATVNRTRQEFEIPRANLDERKDKSYVCQHEGCGKEITIARKERKQKFCSDCKPLVLEEKRLAKVAKKQTT